MGEETSGCLCQFVSSVRWDFFCFSTELLESKGIDSEHLAQTYSFNLNFVKIPIEFFQTKQLFSQIFYFMVALLASGFLFCTTLF